MKKILILQILFISLLTLVSTRSMAQSMTVEQLEITWRTLYSAGLQKFNSHNYNAAQKDFLSAIELLQNNDASGSRYHIYALIKLAEGYYALKDDANLKKTTDKITELKKSIRPGSKKYLDYLYNLGIYYSNTGEYKAGIEALSEAETYNTTLSQIPNMQSMIKHRKALCYYCLGDIQNAIANEELSIAFDNNKEADYIESLIYYLYKTDDWAKLEETLTTCFDYARESVLRAFTHSKNKERAEYWSMHGLFFTEYLPFYAYTHPSQVLSQYAYDAALLSKGVLLAAQYKSDEIVLGINNPELQESYNRYKELKGKKNKTLDEDYEMQALSDVFLRYQKEHKNEFRADFRIRWKDVKNVLSDDDIAIEFQTTRSYTGSTEYFAIVLKKAYSSPKIIKLCNIEDIKKIPSGEIYHSSALYELVWNPLQDELDGVTNIYFSPSGVLYNTGIEYLTNEDGINLNNIYNVCRLSSTKELVLRSQPKLSNAILFGGVNYDTKISELAAQSKDFDFTSQERGISLDSLDIRASSSTGGVAYLPGTMEEVAEISSICEEADISTVVYCGDDGSETSVYSASGSEADIIHIATHGFYYENKSMGKEIVLDKLFKDVNLHFTCDDVVVIDEDKMLTRSGLILAGANNFLKRIEIPKGIQDGILYADEISHMNLSNVKLLVLSACQSGLGYVASSEGVFGLQRGFKLSGVKSIVMSLWKVDDNATKILMTEFYNNLSSSKSIHEALTNAQLHLRTVEDGKYDDPKYWAAFILLDNI